MKKIYLALLCMAGLSMMTACGGDKKADKAADTEGENTEMANEEQNADEQGVAEEQSNSESEAWGNPAKAEVLNLKALYESGDFKPASSVIFEDTLGGETAGELPSQWDIRRGGAEVGEANGHYYITLLGGDTDLAPIVNGGSKDYLTESYTMEFEFMFGRDVWFHVYYFNAEEELHVALVVAGGEVVPAVALEQALQVVVDVSVNPLIVGLGKVPVDRKSVV